MKHGRKLNGVRDVCVFHTRATIQRGHQQSIRARLWGPTSAASSCYPTIIQPLHELQRTAAASVSRKVQRCVPRLLRPRVLLPATREADQAMAQRASFKNSINHAIKLEPRVGYTRNISRKRAWFAAVPAAFWSS